MKISDKNYSIFVTLFSFWSGLVQTMIYRKCSFKASDLKLLCLTLSVSLSVFLSLENRDGSRIFSCVCECVWGGGDLEKIGKN